MLLLTSRALRSFVGGYLAVIIGLYLLDKGFTLPQIGVIFAVGSAVTPLLGTVFGYLGDRFGVKRFLLVSLSSLVVGLVLTYLSSNFFVLLVASALSGYGIVGGLIGGGIGASAAPLFTAMVSKIVRRDELNRTLVVLTAVSSYAGSLGTLLTSLNYSTLFLLGIAISLVSTLVVLPIRDVKRQDDPRAEVSDKRDKTNGASTRKYIQIFTVTALFNGISQGLVVPFIPIIFKLYFGLDNGEIGEIYFFTGLASATAMLFLTDKLANSMGFGRFIAVSRTISAVAALAFPFTREIFLASALFVIFTVFRTLPLPPQQALISSVVSERRRGTALGLNQAARLLLFSASTAGSSYLIPLSLVAPFALALVFTEASSALYYRYFADFRPSVASPLGLD